MDSAHEDRFAWLLSQCTRLTELVIRGFLGQSILDQLPTLCGSLKSLLISRNCETNSSIKLDFRPIYELRQLFFLQNYCEDIIDSAFDLVHLFESNRYLIEVKMSYIRVKKSDKLYCVLTPLEYKNGFQAFENLRGFRHKDLKSNLAAIIDECKELKRN